MIALPGRGAVRDHGHNSCGDREAGEVGMEGLEEAGAATGLDEGPDAFFKLGMMCSTGAGASADYVAAHKWFNLAAMRGCREAIRLRREIAALMSEAEISAAQHAARAWIGR
jgi:TPR repeat protein